MSELTINFAIFPSAFASTPSVGDTISLNLTGIVTKIEDDMVDVTTVEGPPRYIPSRRIATVLVTELWYEPDAA